jgi:hypothetical protein
MARKNAPTTRTRQQVGRARRAQAVAGRPDGPDEFVELGGGEDR